jgi:hypothetical protein
MKIISKRVILLAGALSILIFTSCGRGSATLPELSSKVFEAYKAANEGAFDKCTPSKAQIEGAYMTYFANGAKSIAIQKKSATDTANIIAKSLSESFKAVEAKSTEMGIDLHKAVLKDFKYEVRMRKESFNEAQLNLMIDNGSGKISTMVCTAYQMENKWYVVNGPQWQ